VTIAWGAPAQVRMYLSRQGGEAPRLELSREGIALTPAQRRVVADVLRAANSVNGLWVRSDPLCNAFNKLCGALPCRP